jgi:hypothetical protein
MATWTQSKKDDAIKTIIDRLTNGETLEMILARDNHITGLPEITLFEEWMKTDRVLKTKYLELTRYNSN